MRARAGTSGFSYAEWKGIFYPADAPSDRLLSLYAEKLGVVEINNTFYRMPKKDVVAAWGAQVPEGFSFAIKASRRITHFQKLTNVDDMLGYLFGATEVLGAKLGPILFQLPPQMKKDTAVLGEFLSRLPPQVKCVIEFRSSSWFDDEVYSALRDKNVALCLADSDDEGRTAPIVATADFGYVRLRREKYEDSELDSWATTILAQPWQEAFAFFDHKEEGPLLAQALDARLAER